MIKQDLVCYFITDRPKKLNRIQKSFLKLNKEEDQFVVGGLKIFADGSFGAHTAYMFEPFSDSLKNGFMVNEKEVLYRIFKETNDLGFQIACHAIGDKANRTVVDIYLDMFNKSLEKDKIEKADLRHRIEHASLITKDTLKDAAKLGIIIATQPLFINTEYKWLENRLGPERIKYVYPFKSIIDSGTIIAGASDAPVESPNVLKAIQVAVTRNGFVPEQSITVNEALKMFTYNAAYALKQENIKGSLEKGKLADFVILDQDIRRVPFEKIENIRILATYHRGEKIY